MDIQNITTKKFITFMLIAFGVAYIPLIAAGLFLANGKVFPFMFLFRVVAIFIPLIAVLVSGLPIKKIGFKFKNKVIYYLMALMGPQILSWIGTVIYLVIFKDKFEIGFGSLLDSLPEEYISAFSSSIIDPKFILIPMIFCSLTFIPISQIIPSLGEEAGWRGVMYPFLKAKLGKTAGRLVGGALWGIWHWPLVLIGGHFYGKEYLGAPVLGPVVICIALAAYGIYIDHLYEKTGSIIIASLAHAAMNAAGVPLMLITTSNSNLSIIGPSAFSFIPIIPVVIADVIFTIRSKKA